MANELKGITKMALYRHTVEFPEQMEYALKMDIPELPRRSKVCICGMGASSIAGDILSDFAYGSSDIPIPVVRGLDLPLWIDSDTLAVMISYSGDTGETLCLYDCAMRRGCSVVCITSGGELKRRCLSDGNILVELPPNTSSRASLGYLLGHLAVILEDMGVCGSRTALCGMLDTIKGYRDGLLSEEDSVPLSIAKDLKDRIPVIYGFPNMRSSSLRWKTQINENSKMIAFCGTLPEFNHNEIIGWTEDRSTRNFIPVILYDESASEILRIITDSSIGILEDKGVEIRVVPVNGGSTLEKNLKCILLGDFVSLILAYFRKVDPCSIDAVSKVKECLVSSESAEE